MGSERFLKKTHKKLNEAGMTLVEILAALVILGIVFIGFITIFPQMTLFNEKTGDKLETMNLAKRELASISKVSDLDEKIINSGGKVIDMDVPDKNIKRYEYELKKEGDKDTDYVCVVDLYTEKTLNGETHGDMLHKVTIKIVKDDKMVSETFGYIKD